MSRVFANVSLIAAIAAIAAVGLGCATTSEPAPEPEPEPVVEAVVEPEPEPAPAAVVVAEPVRAPMRELPKTASALPLVGLMGVVALGFGSAIRVARRRASRAR